MAVGGIRQLSGMQIGVESTSGTKVDSTEIWRGPIDFPEDEIEVKEHKEAVAIIGGTDETFISSYGSKWPIAETELTFEQFPYLLASSIKNVTSGSADGAGSGKIYAYPLDTTSVNTRSTLTLEAFDNQQEEEAGYGYCRSWKLTGKGGNSGNAWMMAAELGAQQLAPGTKTAALALPAIEIALFPKSKLFIDAIGGTVGSTQITGTFLAADITYDSGLLRKYTGDGSLDYTFTYLSEPKITGSILFEHNATGVTQKATWRAQTAKLMRIQILGNALTSAGTTYTYKTINLDFAMKFTKVDPIGEENGNNTVLAHFTSKYNTTAATRGTITVVNERANITS
jgi:hypothetical protein